MDWLTSVFGFLINRPLILLGLMAWPLFVVARYRGCYPSSRLLWLAGIPAVLSISIAFVPAVSLYVLIVDVVLVFAALLDLMTIASARRFTASRDVIHIASLGKSHDAEITLSNHSPRSVQIVVRDDLPDQFKPTEEEFRCRLEGNSRAFFAYQFTSSERGKFNLNCVHVKVGSRLGLWRGFYQVPAESEVNVYPDMKQIAQYDLLARTDRLNLVGVRRSRRIGQDNEFERLRDYTQDDNYRHIDWRTTARRRRLTVRDFQSNQSQRIVFLIDCGRMMTASSGEICLLDHAFNAMLMLGYVALRQGDSVGLICFSDVIHNYTPPRGGVNHINRLLHASFDKHPRYVESRYDHAFLYLRTHCLKRSLVVLVTNVIDEINSHQIHQYLGSLVGRHLPLGVLLKDHQLFDVVDHFGGDENRLYQAAAAAEIITWRHQVINDLQHKGVLALDVFPEQLTSRLVNQYLEIKARHLL